MTEPFSISTFNMHEDPRGKLISIEGMRDVPFEIARVYYILGAEGTQRTNSGEITGFYSDANGVFHGFDATPRRS